MTHRRLFRGAVLTAVALSLALASYVPSARAASSASPKVTITVWNAYTHGLGDAFNHLVTKFQTLYPNITVQSIVSPNYTALFQKEESAVLAGNPPTVGQAYESYVRQFNGQHAIQNLAPYINGKSGLSKKQINDFFAKDWKDGLLGKQRLMMPFSKSDIVLYFNRALLKKNGISSPPKTWYQFSKDCKKLTKRSGGRVTQWCTTIQMDESNWFTWEREWGGQVLSHGKAAFDNRKGMAPVEFFRNLVKKGEVVVSNNFNYQDQADFDAGKTGFDISTSAGRTYEVSGAKPGVEVAETTFPAGPAHRATEIYGAPMTMFKKASAAEKSAGWLFLKWLTEPRQTAYWAENTGYMPVRKSALKLSSMKKYYKQFPQDRASVQQLKYAISEPTYSGWSKAQTDLETDLIAALSGTKSVPDAMKSAAAQVNSDLGH
ncbi:MAG: extracellular solute-binding protein [Chloroflexota bacterium]